MSVRAIVWAFEQELPCAHKFVLVALADAADIKNCCWPAQGRLAKLCGLSRQYVNKVLGDLERDGLIEIVSRTRANGSDASNQYRLLGPDQEPDTREKPKIAGFVYLLRCAGKLKIGITRDLDRRTSALRTQNGETVELVHSWRTETMRAARGVEAAAHRRFATHRMQGEWFRLDASVAIPEIDGLVSTEATPGVNRGDTSGVNHDDTGVSTTLTPRTVKLEPKKEEREAKASPKKAATRWAGAVSEEWIGEAAGIRSRNCLPPIDARLEAEKFADYWIAAGANGSKRDWRATWRNWVRNAKAPRESGHARRSPVEKLYAGFAQAAGYSGADSPPDEPLLDWRRS